MSHSNVYSEAEARTLAAQVDRVLPPTLSFFRYGDRITHIIRFLIENEMDVAKTVVAIKQTALFRKYWHADEIAITDIQNAFSEMHCFPTGVTADGKIVWYADCFIQHPVNVEDFMLASIYMLDDLQRQLYEECKARGIREAYKDYCIIVSDTARTSMSALTTDIQKAGFDVFIRHFPSFMSVSNIFIDENPQYKPAYSWETSTVFNMNTALYLRVLWNMCTFFLPSRWAYMVQLLGGQTLPSTIPPSFIPSKYGGESHYTFENWLEECAQRDNVALDTPPRSLVDERVLKQFGKNSGMIASEISGTILKGWLWKRTNAGHRWHHYYFVALGEGILYYFKNIDDSNAQNGLLLENCRIVPCSEHEDLKREGINSLTIASNVLKYVNPPLLEAGQTEELRGEEDPKGMAHGYWFILRTPSRDYTFACNTVSQRSQWMYLLNKLIIESDARSSSFTN